MVAIVVLAGGAAWAQEPRVEISGTAGWTFSDGVSGNAIRALDGNVYDRLDPKDAFSWGARLGVMASENMEVGFLFNQQMSSLEASGTTTRKIGDEKIYNYHGYFAYNFGDPSAQVRPYILGGAGATQFGGVNYTDILGRSGSIGGNTKFSTTWAVGVKIFPGRSAGIRLEARWTPTYIKSDSAGWWCDPYWGCYVVGNAQYANQFDLNGGITLRF
jgi:hypothetical protein